MKIYLYQNGIVKYETGTFEVINQKAYKCKRDALKYLNIIKELIEEAETKEVLDGTEDYFYVKNIYKNYVVYNKHEVIELDLM